MTEELAKTVERVASALRAAGAREVYLFGSVAAATAGEASDVDLAVAGLPPKVFFQAMGEAAEILGRRLDLVDLDEENPFTRYLKEEGELVRIA